MIALLALLALPAHAMCIAHTRPIVIAGLALDASVVRPGGALDHAVQARAAALRAVEEAPTPEDAPREHDPLVIPMDAWRALVQAEGAEGRYARLQLASDLADGRFAGDVDAALALLDGRTDTASALLREEILYRGALVSGGSCDDVLDLKPGRPRHRGLTEADVLAQRDGWQAGLGRVSELLGARYATTLGYDNAMALLAGLPDGPRPVEEPADSNPAEPEALPADDIERSILNDGDLRSCVSTFPDDSWVHVTAYVAMGRVTGVEGSAPACVRPRLHELRLAPTLNGRAELWMTRITLEP